MINPDLKPICIGCERTPEEIGYDEYLEEGETATEYVIREEGTLNPVNYHFACDACYMRMGMPVGPNGNRWVAP